MTTIGGHRHPGLILAGGRSSRMGAPKALLPFGQNRLVDHVADRLRPQVSALFLNSNDPAIALPGVTSLTDTIGDFAGPLAGIHRGLCHIRAAMPEASHLLTLPVDCPFFPRDLALCLSGSLTRAEDVALGASDGQFHPVIGLWPVTLADKLGTWLADPPTLKVRAFLEGEPLRVVAFPLCETPQGALDPFFNINTPDDHTEALRMLREGSI
jgi:molybdenum cofactor guanylyltransferase